MDSKPETLTTLTASLDSYSNFYQVVIFISIFHEEADVDKPGASSTHTTGLTQSQSLNIVLTSNIHNNDQYPYFSFTVSFILSRNLILFFFFKPQFLCIDLWGNSAIEFSLWLIQQYCDQYRITCCWTPIGGSEPRQNAFCFFLLTCWVQGQRTFQN